MRWLPQPVRWSLLLTVIALARPAGAAEVRLLSEGLVRANQFVPVLVTGLAEGEHELSGPDVLPVRWSGSGERIVPVFIRSGGGGTLDFEVDGEPFALAVRFAGEDERVLVDVGGVYRGNEQSGWTVVSARPTDVARSPALAWSFADVMAIIGAPHAGDWRGPLERSGVQCLSPETAEAAPDREAFDLVLPEAFAPSLGWKPGRPWGDVVILTLLLGGLLAAVTGATLLRLAPGRRLVVVGIVSLVIAGAAMVWAQVRPNVVTRIVDVPRAGGVDRWVFVKGPEAVTARVAVDGLTRPVVYSRRHLEQLQPTLHLDETGRPGYWSLQLPAGGTGLVLQQVSGDADEAEADDPWADRLARDLYR